DDADPAHRAQDQVQRRGPAQLLPRERDLAPPLRGAGDPAHHHAAPGGDALAPDRAHPAALADPHPHAHPAAAAVVQTWLRHLEAAIRSFLNSSKVRHRRAISSRLARFTIPFRASLRASGSAGCAVESHPCRLFLATTSAIPSRSASPSYT